MSNFIVVTRVKSQSRQIATKLNQKGLKTIIEPLFTLQELPFKVTNPKTDAIIITSANGAQRFLTANFNQSIKIFAVGKKTAQTLINAGYNNITYPKEENGLELKKLIINHFKNNQAHLTYFCAKKVYLDFAKELPNYNVEKIICYQMNPINQLSQEFGEKFLKKELDFILLYSQNSVDVFFESFLKFYQKTNLKKYDSRVKLLCFSTKIQQHCQNIKDQLELDFFEVANFSQAEFCKIL